MKMHECMRFQVDMKTTNKNHGSQMVDRDLFKQF